MHHPLLYAVRNRENVQETIYLWGVACFGKAYVCFCVYVVVCVFGLVGRGGHVSCFRLWFIAVPGNAAPGPGRACPNAFQRAHQPWLNTCYGARTKRANPICISDILNIVQSPGITRSFSARWNPKTYFSNLWTDDKSKLSRGQWNIHQRAENTLGAQRCGLERAHRCGVYGIGRGVCFSWNIRDV